MAKREKKTLDVTTLVNFGSSMLVMVERHISVIYRLKLYILMQPELLSYIYRCSYVLLPYGLID